MQGQRDSFISLPESLHFDCGSNSNISDMDQPIYQSDLLLNSVETPTLADFLLSPNEANMDYMTISSQGTDDFGVSNSQYPNTNSFLVNQENHDETKFSDGSKTSLSISSGSSQRMEGRRSVGTNLSFENVGLNLNLNSSPVEEPAFSQSLNLTNASQNVDMCADSHGRNVSLCPFIPKPFEYENFPCSNSKGSSSSGVGHVSENDSREKNLGRCKRKNMDGVIGEASTSRISVDLNIPSSSMHLTSPSSLEENQSPSLSRLHRGLSSEWYPPSSISRNAEIVQRNLRARLNLSFQNDVSSSQTLFPSGNRLSSYRSPGEPSSNLNPLIHSAEESLPHTQPVSLLPHNIHHPPSISRIANLAFLQQRMRLIAAYEEINQRNLPTNGVTAHPTFLARTSVEPVQNPQNWSPSNSNLSMWSNGVGSSSGFNPLPVTTREPSEIVPLHPRNLIEAARSSLFPSGGSESGHPITTLPSLHTGRSASTQEPGQSSRAVWQGHSQPYLGTTALTDTQHGLSPLPLSARIRDRRSRMISEIRNALDLMRRRGNLRFEDIFFDHSGFYGRPDFLDRHRDLRLDVDNMSYEELLALEERIGYVSTGLCEQAVLKCLKKRVYSSCNLAVSAGEPEPCCICQEHYNEGDDIGTLDCRHDFHTRCIKQWLMIKNLCPICKTTALVEGRGAVSDETK